MIKVCEADMTMTPAMLVAEKTRLTERIAKIDIDRTRLATELYDIEAAERAMAKFGTPGAAAQRARGRPRKEGIQPAATETVHEATKPTKPTKPTTNKIARPRAGGAKAATGNMSLSDAVLAACASFSGGAEPSKILTVVERQRGITVRPNHVGAALARHERAGRLNKHDGLWFVPEAAKAIAA
jgi:hypothetical protein